MCTQSRPDPPRLQQVLSRDALERFTSDAGGHMTPPTPTPATGAARRHAGSHGYGLVLFASVLLVLTGCFNLVQGIAAAAGSGVFQTHPHFVFANLTTWGWVTA